MPELLGESLDLIEEKRERAMIHLTYYHQKLKQGYDVNVKLKAIGTRRFSVKESRRYCQKPIIGKAWVQLGRAIPNYFGSRNRCVLLRRLR